MHKAIVILAILITTTLTAELVSSEEQIPDIVWVYVEPEQLTLTQKICLRNIQYHTQQSNYGLRIVSADNYTQYLPKDTNLTAQLPQNMLVSKQAALKTMIKLTLLYEHGGIWLELPLFLVEEFTWLEHVNNEKYINNRINHPQVVMFYQPSLLWGWLDSKEPVRQPKVEDIVVAPRYASWFVAAQPQAAFIKDWKSIYLQMSTKTYPSAKAMLKPLTTWVPWNYLDENEIEAWTARVTVELKQVVLNSKEQDMLAVRKYKIGAVDASQSAFVVDTQANGFLHLAAKYYSEVPLDKLKLKLNYLIRLEPEVESEIEEMIDDDVPQIEHLHSSVAMVCEGQEYPYRYVVKGSLLDTYLLSPFVDKSVRVYDPDWIKRKCSSSYFGVYFQFLFTYVLPVGLIALHVYVVRKAVLVFRPDWGLNRKERIQKRKKEIEQEKKRQARLEESDQQ